MTRPVATVACPSCGREVKFVPASRWRPFCSQRCKSLDLGAWAAERYRIAGAMHEEPPEVDERGEARRDESSSSQR